VKKEKIMNVSKVPFYAGIKASTGKNPVTKFVKSVYNASRPLDMAPTSAPKLSLGTQIVKFFKGLINANIK
jgi:hypothetical protein